jgi:hypothetical protein
VPYLEACGYRLARKTINLPTDMKSIAIPLLINKTTVQEVEQLLTRSLIQQFSERTALRVSAQIAGSDAILQGEILSVTASPVLFGAETFTSTFLVTLQANIRIISAANHKVLFENPSYIFRDQYAISADVKQFFSEQNPALRRMAKDFAASVVATFLNGF